MRGGGRICGKATWNEGLGEGSSSLEMKLGPQVCESETISGRVFSLSHKWQRTVQLGSGDTGEERKRACDLAEVRSSVYQLPTCSSGISWAAPMEVCRCVVTLTALWVHLTVIGPVCGSSVLQAGREGLAGWGLERNLRCSPLCKQLHVKTSHTGSVWSTNKDTEAFWYSVRLRCFPLRNLVNWFWQRILTVKWLCVSLLLNGFGSCSPRRPPQNTAECVPSCICGDLFVPVILGFFFYDWCPV